MDKYIDANATEAAIKELDSGIDYTVYHFLELIDAMPAADVEPVRHGKWLYEGSVFGGGVVYSSCSNCGHLKSRHERANYCPNCGAKMDGR